MWIGGNKKADKMIMRIATSEEHIQEFTENSQIAVAKESQRVIF